MPSRSTIDPRFQLQIEYLPTTSLVLNPNNAQDHSEAQVRKLGASMLRNGCPNPLLIDDKNVVWCGNGRLMAALRVGISELPTIRLNYMSDADLRAFALVDNRIAQDSSWSKKMLKAELQGLAELGYELELTGFTTLEIDTVLSLGDDEPESSADDIVELPGDSLPVSRMGDVWHIGQNRLIHGNSCEPSTLERLLDGELAQLVITDPPYNVKIAGNVSGLGRHTHGEFVMGSGELSDAEFVAQLLRPAFRNIARHAAPGTICFVFIDWRGAPQLLDAAQGVFLKPKNMIVWVKTNAGMGSFYRSQHELIYVFQVSAGETINNFGLGKGGRHRSNVWTYPGANSFRRGRMEDLTAHPTVKPKKLVADAIIDCSRRGGIVLDVFAGSGTGLVAAAMTGRRGYGVELDGRYCDVALRRIAAACGEPARLERGPTFAEVAAERGISI